MLSEQRMPKDKKRQGPETLSLIKSRDTRRVAGRDLVLNWKTRILILCVFSALLMVPGVCSRCLVITLD